MQVACISRFLILKSSGRSLVVCAYHLGKNLPKMQATWLLSLWVDHCKMEAVVFSNRPHLNGRKTCQLPATRREVPMILEYFGRG